MAPNPNFPSVPARSFRSDGPHLVLPELPGRWLPTARVCDGPGSGGEGPVIREGVLANPALSYFGSRMRAPQHIQPYFSVLIVTAITHGALTCTRYGFCREQPIKAVFSSLTLLPGVSPRGALSQPPGDAGPIVTRFQGSSENKDCTVRGAGGERVCA